MDASAADYTDVTVSLMRQPEQDRALVGIDLHGEFIPFAELKLSAVDEMLANAADRHAQQQQVQPATEPTPPAQTPQAEPATEPQAPQLQPAPQVESAQPPAEPQQPAQPTEPQQPTQ